MIRARCPFVWHGQQLQWVQSSVTGTKVYCVYVALSEDLVRKH